MSMKKISEAILGVGVDDTTIDLFESQYPVPTGVSYNSYVILDEKTTILDTVDARATEPWLENLAEALGGRKPAYLVVSHMEPDHGANVAKLAALYPEMQVVGNAKTFQYMEQFFGADAIVPEPRGSEGRREPEPWCPHPHLCVCPHGALAGGHGQLREQREGAVLRRWLWPLWCSGKV